MTSTENETDEGARSPATIPGAGTVDVLDTEVFKRFLAAAEGETTEVDADRQALNIIGRILNATTVDDVLGGRIAIHARDMLGEPFTLLGVRFNESTIDGDGPAFYAVLEAVDPEGEPMAITCGARNVMAQAWKLKDMGALPVAVMIQQSDRQTKAGYRVMWLEAVPEGF